MGDAIDLTGDGGVTKTVVRRPKENAVSPSEDLPLVDGQAHQAPNYWAMEALAYIITHLNGHIRVGRVPDSFNVGTILKGPGPPGIFWTDAICFGWNNNMQIFSVHYEGVLAETGDVFDTTHEDNTIFSFEIGKGTVIKAWDIAIRTMKVGEIAKITCKPEYAYGSAGSPPDVPPEPRKGLSVGGAADERARLEELRNQREAAAAMKEEEKKKREEAKAAAAARIQAKMTAKKGGKGKSKTK